MLTVRSAGETGQLVEQHAGGRCHHCSAFQMRNHRVVEKAVPEPPVIVKCKCKAGGNLFFFVQSLFLLKSFVINCHSFQDEGCLMLRIWNCGHVQVRQLG